MLLVTTSLQVENIHIENIINIYYHVGNINLYSGPRKQSNLVLVIDLLTSKNNLQLLLMYLFAPRSTQQSSRLGLSESSEAIAPLDYQIPFLPLLSEDSAPSVYQRPAQRRSRETLTFLYNGIWRILAKMEGNRSWIWMWKLPGRRVILE